MIKTPAIFPSYAILRCGLVGVLLSSCIAGAAAEMVVTHAEAIDPTNKRMRYEMDVLTLALEKTRPEFGPYRIETYPFPSRARITRELIANTRSNTLHNFGYSDENPVLKRLAFVPFPVYLGALGYRVCFVSDQAKSALAAAESMSDIRAFLHGQGRGWSDVRVLKHNGFKVKEVDRELRLIRMTAANEIQLFCRGINEIGDEWKQHRGLKGLNVDSRIVLYYPHPRFFYTHKANTELLARVEAGLRLAYEDGSLLALFLAAHGESLNFVNLPQRRLFRLENPLVDKLKFDMTPFLQHYSVVATPTPSAPLDVH